MLLVNINDDLSPGVTRKMISLYPREVTAGRHWWTLLHMGSVLILAYLLIGSFIDAVVLGPDPRPGPSGRVDTLGSQTHLVHTLPEAIHNLSLILSLQQRSFNTCQGVKISIILGWSTCSSCGRVQF